jgi:hypothetical protein
MFQCSGVETALQILIEGYETLYIYSNPAYSDTFDIVCLWKDPQSWRYLSQDKQRFNQTLSSVWIAVKQSFEKTYSL